MVPRPTRFDERAVLYIGLPALFVIAVALVVFAVLAAVFTVPSWGYVVTAGFIAFVLVVAVVVAIVSYIGAWFHEAPR